MYSNKKWISKFTLTVSMTLALASALARLIREPARRAALGAAGERRVRRDFAMAPGIARLVALFAEA